MLAQNGPNGFIPNWRRWIRRPGSKPEHVTIDMDQVTRAWEFPSVSQPPLGQGSTWHLPCFFGARCLHKMHSHPVTRSKLLMVFLCIFRYFWALGETSCKNSQLFEAVFELKVCPLGVEYPVWIALGSWKFKASFTLYKKSPAGLTCWDLHHLAAMMVGGGKFQRSSGKVGRELPETRATAVGHRISMTSIALAQDCAKHFPKRS